MKKSFFKNAFVLILILFFSMQIINLYAADTPPVNLSIKIDSIDNISPDFIKGVDVSMLNQIEKNSGKFYDTDGKEKDCLEILKNKGVNYIRLRLWNNPVFSKEMIENRKLTNVKPGDPVGGGNCDLAMVKKISKRAKALGMKVLLDFHYSDFWADPGNQMIPDAWKKLNAKKMAVAIYDYTKSVLIELKNENIAPEIVQLGNEVKNGICWPVGHFPSQKVAFFNLLKNASKAVKDVLPETKVMIHIPDGGNNLDSRYFFDYVFISYDIIGLSYYPFWDKPIDSLIQNLNDITAKTKKPVIVVETAYAYTLENGDKHDNMFSEDGQNRGGYKATVQGQALCMRDIMAAVAQVPRDRGLGVFYWEPDWIPVDGCGWITGEGNAWDNMAWWDKNGKPLESIWTYLLVNEKNKKYKYDLVSVPDISVTTNAKVAPVLPDTVNAWHTSDSLKPVQIVWDKIDPKEYDKGGAEFVVQGSVKDSSVKVKANVSVSLLQNPGFELGDKSGWKFDPADGIKDEMETKAGNVRTGKYALGFWAPAGFKFKAFQTIAGLKPGKYRVSVWTEGGGGEFEYYFYATSGAVTKKKDIKDTVWPEWHQYVIEIDVDASQTLTIGLYCNAAGGNWGTIDDFELVPIK
ncbi:MAG: glycosyl hydrolase 53 family protein [Spirochaetes bacterium]|nr:glycosyl hydrolase 53 family protein [Spirochaetota bacterium]